MAPAEMTTPAEVAAPVKSMAATERLDSTAEVEPKPEHASKGMQSEQTDSSNSDSIQFFAPIATNSAANDFGPTTMGELSERLARMNEIERAAEEVRLRNSIRPEQFKHDNDIRRSGMAYWRKNTRKERPSDALFYEQLTSPANSWQDPFTADSRAAQSSRSRNAASELGKDLSVLSAFLTTKNKTYLAGIHAQKNQAEIDSQSLQILPRIPDVRDRDKDVPSTQNYPHYSGGWAPEKQEYIESQFSPNSVESIDDLEHKHEWEWNMPAALAEKAVQTEEKTSSEISGGVDQENIEAQSTTQDPVPYEQFVDVRIAFADHPDTSMQVLLALAHDINPDVRFAIAENHNADEEVLRMLTEDENPYVAHRAVKTLQRIEGGIVKHGDFAPRDAVVINDRISECY